MKLLLSILSFSFVHLIIGQNSIDANIPDKLTAFSTQTIEITINKGPISSFSKYQIDVPENITVSEGLSLEGHFSFEKGRAKVVWVDSPKPYEFKITMIMHIGNVSGSGTFEHRYYYIDSETKKEIADGPMEVDFVAGTSTASSQKDSEVKKVAPTKTVSVVTNTVNTKTTNTVATVTNEAKSVSTPTTKVEEPKKTTISIPASTPSTHTTTANNTNSVASTSQPNSSNTTPVSLPQLKEYKVQIGSLNGRPDLSKYGNIGKLTVTEEDGKYKVLVGEYKTKEEAVLKMEELKKAGFPGFVVCLINGVKVK